MGGLKSLNVDETTHERITALRRKYSLDMGNDWSNAQTVDAATRIAAGHPALMRRAFAAVLAEGTPDEQDPTTRPGG